ncbi:MAG: M1 family aminopeptidase, partial [Pyrinomonadaceae bacterium]
MLLYPATYTPNVGILFAALREIFPGTKSMLLKILPILVLAMLFFTFAFSQTPPIEPGVSQTLAKWRAARYSDVRYKLNLTLEKMSPVLKGTIEIRVKVGTRTPSSATLLKGTRTPSSATLLNSEIPPIVLDWRKIKGFEDRSTISQVTINGKAAENGSPQAAIADEGVRVPFEEHNEHLIFRDGVVIGENVIKLDFTSPILTSGSAITRYVDKEDGAEYIYSLFVPSDASTAFPVFDQPDLKARFTLEATTPHDWQLASNTDAEVTISTDSLPAKLLKKHVFRATRPISTYVFAFATGPWSIFENVGDSSRTAAPIDRVSASSYLIYVRQSQADKFKPHAAEVFRLNREGIKYLESYFDYKFPFPKYDLVLIPEFPFGGMEHAGATFLREDRVI